MIRSLLFSPLLVVLAAPMTLEDVVSRYRGWGPVESTGRWAPVMCAPAGGSTPTPKARISKAESAHDEKLYVPFAKDRDAYLAGT